MTERGDEKSSKAETKTDPRPAATVEALVGKASRVPTAGARDLQSGLLTAGSFDDNPSPGNKEGGLTNILEKSLGAVAKGGTSPLMEVYDYA